MLRLWQKLSGRIPSQGRWQHMAAPYDGDEIVVLDCETSVFDKRKGELLSVAAVRVKGKEIMLSSAIDITVKSDAVTDPNAVRVHYLRREDREQGVAVSEAIEKLLDFIGKRSQKGRKVNSRLEIESMK